MIVVNIKCKDLEFARVDCCVDLIGVFGNEESGPVLPEAPIL